MKAFLEVLLPRLYPGLNFLCVPHEGKADLEASLQRKLRAWREPNCRFMIVRDNDGADCRAVKQRLAETCRASGRADAMIRIVCQELEAWYLGDLNALGRAYSVDLSRRTGRAARRDPDAVVTPSRVVKSMIPAFQKIDGARRIALHVDPQKSRSVSFRKFLAGVEALTIQDPGDFG